MHHCFTEVKAGYATTPERARPRSTLHASWDVQKADRKCHDSPIRSAVLACSNPVRGVLFIEYARRISSFLFFIGAAAGLGTGIIAVRRRADEKQKGCSIKGGRSIDRSPLAGFAVAVRSLTDATVEDPCKVQRPRAQQRKTANQTAKTRSRPANQALLRPRTGALRCRLSYLPLSKVRPSAFRPSLAPENVLEAARNSRASKFPTFVFCILNLFSPRCRAVAAGRISDFGFRIFGS
jgi:hypothetical protein